MLRILFASLVPLLGTIPPKPPVASVVPPVPPVPLGKQNAARKNEIAEDAAKVLPRCRPPARGLAPRPTRCGCGSWWPTLCCRVELVLPVLLQGFWCCSGVTEVEPVVLIIRPSGASQPRFGEAQTCPYCQKWIGGPGCAGREIKKTRRRTRCAVRPVPGGWHQSLRLAYDLAAAPFRDGNIPGLGPVLPGSAAR